MAKKTEEKNIKGTKATKKVTAKKTNEYKKNNHNVVKNAEVIETKVEIKEAPVAKKEIKKGSKENCLMNNTPFIICIYLVIYRLYIYLNILPSI